MPANAGPGATQSDAGADSKASGTANREEAHGQAGAQAAPVGSRLIDVARAASLKAERMIIEDTLHLVHWNRRRAAEQLGVSYKTLLNKIKDCGISRKA